MPSDDKDSVLRFADVAARFCHAMETDPVSTAQNIEELRLLAAELHLAVLGLPDLQPEEGAPWPKVDRTRISARRFAELPADFYWDVFEPLVLDPEAPVCNSIVDDLNDIYGDVKLGSLLHEQGYPAQACWQWRFLFNTHWGEHLVGLIRALYWIVREDQSIVDSEIE